MVIQELSYKTIANHLSIKVPYLQKHEMVMVKGTSK